MPETSGLDLFSLSLTCQLQPSPPRTTPPASYLEGYTGQLALIHALCYYITVFILCSAHISLFFSMKNVIGYSNTLRVSVMYMALWNGTVEKRVRVLLFRLWHQNARGSAVSIIYTDELLSVRSERRKGSCENLKMWSCLLYHELYLCAHIVCTYQRVCSSGTQTSVFLFL